MQLHRNLAKACRPDCWCSQVWVLPRHHPDGLLESPHLYNREKGHIALEPPHVNQKPPRPHRTRRQRVLRILGEQQYTAARHMRGTTARKRLSPPSTYLSLRLRLDLHTLCCLAPFDACILYTIAVAAKPSANIGKRKHGKRPADSSHLFDEALIHEDPLALVHNGKPLQV